ncbi:SDR family oxidoreductase [Candidatus Viadribacter manganicus]|uniref:Serine/threonine protein kinase n=1 Tax=Candidatus Viadribacter manganicus TaxID=1759059 RepID=A0A1B1AJJ7_9PROT|nr:SDR family oxidoreductase [Candidatus Viadribacter manganicus]ANP46721.1 serine/threonine protein kinase [Candidatus Viadribacter manganicus]
MNKDLRFDGRVALVTGAGGGLGREHARLLAARGAKVLVNDLTQAEATVQDIVGAGGAAMANTESVIDGGRIVEAALDAFGRVDIVVNNAGFLRDTAFHNMSDKDWGDIYEVHLLGAFRVTRAAWPHMRTQGYGRVVNTSSAAGIYGNFGQTNYSSMKLALHGFTQALAVEGRSKNVHANTIAPAADSQLTRTVMSEEQLRPMRPEYVSPLAAWLCHEECAETGALFEAGGGWFGKLRWQRSDGARLDAANLTIESVREAWPRIAGFEHAHFPGSMAEGMAPFAEIMNPA